MTRYIEVYVNVNVRSAKLSEGCSPLGFTGEVAKGNDLRRDLAGDGCCTRARGVELQLFARKPMMLSSAMALQKLPKLAARAYACRLEESVGLEN